MSSCTPWVSDANVALLTDLYELTMLQAYWREGMEGEAVFSLVSRRLPPGRNYLIACGLADVLRYLQELRFEEDALLRLRSVPGMEPDFVDHLADFRFAGDVWAVPEGTPVFPQEPILEVHASIAQAQLAETLVVNQVHLQTMLASKASRVVTAARGRTVVDFGLRRMHGADAGLRAARAFHIAGVHATSNVLAGVAFGIPVSGTMAHSFVQAFDHEADAFRAFARTYPETVLLVDTYDTVEGVRRVVRLAEELGEGFRVRGVRLDSGDLAGLAMESRAILDAAGLHDVTIFASGSLDEYEIARMLDGAAPIDGFGVGTHMGVSSDAPALDMVYKLVAYEGTPRLKLSTGKGLPPGPKQVFRTVGGGESVRDFIGRRDEVLPGQPLLRKVMEGGEVLEGGIESLEAIRERARREVAALPERLRRLEPADPPYPVTLSEGLRELQAAVAARVTGGGGEQRLL